MPVEVIYIVRHAFRMSYTLNHLTHEYTTTSPLPTGIPTDPVLTAHGIHQSAQLATHLSSLDPPIDRVYCSPYYRCLQTLAPAMPTLAPRTGPVRVETGFAEFHGRAPFKHPDPAGLEELNGHFGWLDQGHRSVVGIAQYGETIEALHERVAEALARTVRGCDAEAKGPRAILICTHAAAIIAMGRVLTGEMPRDVAEEDFQCFTAGLSVFRRKGRGGGQEDRPGKDWKGKGVEGGWVCEKNSDCSFLSGGAERGWKFYGDESFMVDPNSFNDKVLEEKDEAKL